MGTLAAGASGLRRAGVARACRLSLLPSWAGQTQPRRSFPGLQRVGLSSRCPGAAPWYALELEEPHLDSVGWEGFLSVPLQGTLPLSPALDTGGCKNLFPGFSLIIKGPSCPTPLDHSPPRTLCPNLQPLLHQLGLLQFSSAIACHPWGHHLVPSAPSLLCLLCLCPSRPDPPGCSRQHSPTLPI